MIALSLSLARALSIRSSRRKKTSGTLIIFWGEGGRAFRDCAVQPLLRHCFVHDACQVCSAIKPWNHLHMRSVLLWTKIVVECLFLWDAWLAAEKKPGKTGKQWCYAWVAARVIARGCFYWPENCEIICRSGFANVDIVFLICLMLIFERPIQITPFRHHLVSVI